MAQVLANQVALEAATRSRLTSRRNADTLVSRLSSNDPSLTHLKLVRKPATYFDDQLDGFLVALEENKTVTSVELSWRFLSALPVDVRQQVMGSLGGLHSLEKIFMEAIGPCEALVAALERARNLKTLWIGALRLSSNAEVAQLTDVLKRNVSLQQINLSNIRLRVQGTYRMDRGRVYFQQNEPDAMKKLDLNPLLMAIADIPAMQKIQLGLQLNPERMVRIAKPTLQRICQPGRIFLMLRSCDLDDDDMAVLASQLKHGASTLEALNLTRNNKITEFGWKLIASMMETNYSLTCVYTPTTTGPMEANQVLAGRFASYVQSRNAALMEPGGCTPPSPETRGKMDLMLKLNEKGRKMLLSDPTVTRADWLDFITREIGDLDVVFYALQYTVDLFFV